MTNKKIISGIGFLIILVVILAGIHYFKVSSHSNESSVDLTTSTTSSARPYSQADNNNNDSGSMNIMDHLGKAMNHIGL